MMKYGNIAITAAALALVGCGLLQINGRPLELSSGSSSSEQSASEGSETKARGPYTPPPEAKERLAVCGQKIQESQKVWAEQEKKTRAAIKEAEQAGLYEGWLALTNQYRDNCKASKRLGNQLDERVYRSTAVEMSLAVARFQLRHNVVMRSPLVRSNEGTAVYDWVPLGEDDQFNQAESCRTLGRDIDYLSTDEFNAWKAKREPLIKKQSDTLDQLFKAIDAAAPTVGGDYGKVKKLQKLPDGSLKLSMVNLYGGAECVHTGNWRFNGTFWTDCDYKAAPEKEIYPFTTTWAPARIPKHGIQVGDKLSFWGHQTKPGADEKHPKEGAEYDGIIIMNQLRGNNGILELRTFESPMNCVRED